VKTRYCTKFTFLTTTQSQRQSVDCVMVLGSSLVGSVVLRVVLCSSLVKSTRLARLRNNRRQKGQCPLLTATAMHRTLGLNVIGYWTTFFSRFIGYIVSKSVRHIGLLQGDVKTAQEQKLASEECRHSRLRHVQTVLATSIFHQSCMKRYQRLPSACGFELFCKSTMLF
jgi:hypothetical protein